MLPDFFIPCCSKYSLFTKWCFPLSCSWHSKTVTEAIAGDILVSLDHYKLHAKSVGKMTFLRTLQLRYTSSKREKVFSGSVHFIFNSSSILSSKQNLLVSEEKTTDQVTRCPNDFDDISTSSEIMTGTTESNRRSGVGRYHDNRWYKDTKKMLRIILVSLNLK